MFFFVKAWNNFVLIERQSPSELAKRIAMSSPSITSFFPARKRAATDDVINSRNKLSRLEAPTPSSDRAKSLLERAISTSAKAVVPQANAASAPTTNATKLASTPTVERHVTRASSKRSAAATSSKQQKIVKFTLGGSLSPRKNAAPSPAKLFKAVEKNADAGSLAEQSSGESKLSTPSSSKSKANVIQRNVSGTKKQLTFDDIKSKIGRSAHVGDLKSSLSKFQQLQDQYKACIDKRNAKIKANSPVKLDGQTLKQFDTIELEVLSRLVQSITCMHSVFCCWVKLRKYLQSEMAKLRVVGLREKPCVDQISYKCDITTKQTYFMTV